MIHLDSRFSRIVGFLDGPYYWPTMACIATGCAGFLLGALVGSGAAR